MLLVAGVVFGGAAIGPTGTFGDLVLAGVMMSGGWALLFWAAWFR